MSWDRTFGTSIPSLLPPLPIRWEREILASAVFPLNSTFPSSVLSQDLGFREVSEWVAPVSCHTNWGVPYGFIIIFTHFVLHLLSLLLFLNLIRNLGRKKIFFIEIFQNTQNLLIYFNCIYDHTHNWQHLYINIYIWTIVLLSYNNPMNFWIINTSLTYSTFTYLWVQSILHEPVFCFWSLVQLIHYTSEQWMYAF